VVQVVAFSNYLRKGPEVAAGGAPAPPATVAQLVDSISYAVKKIGIDHVGISSDFNHGGGVAGWQNEAEAQNVTVELLRKGYSERDIVKLWGGNFLRVWGQAQMFGKNNGRN
jgi:microsomal dipeptidase-like Zn-dependent dipeptidase